MKTANKNVLTATPSVETDDLLDQAITAACERAVKVYAKGRKTLIDQIPIDQWLEWDASDELAIVADSAGLDDDDEDGCCLDAAA